MAASEPTPDVPSAEPPEPPQPQPCGLATASLVLGVLGIALCLGPVTGIPAVVCGHAALSRIDRSRGALTGRGQAVGGLAAGYLATFVLVPVLALLSGVALPGVSHVREITRRVHCMNNLKQIGVAIRMYASDNAEHYPSGLGILRQRDYVLDAELFACPAARGGGVLERGPGAGASSYVYTGAGLTEDCRGNPPGKTILAYDAPGNHRRYVNVLFADGHVQGFAGEEGIEEIARRNGLFLPARVPAP